MEKQDINAEDSGSEEGEAEVEDGLFAGSPAGFDSVDDIDHITHTEMILKEKGLEFGTEEYQEALRKIREMKQARLTELKAELAESYGKADEIESRISKTKGAILKMEMDAKGVYNKEKAEWDKKKWENADKDRKRNETLRPWETKRKLPQLSVEELSAKLEELESEMIPLKAELEKKEEEVGEIRFFKRLFGEGKERYGRLRRDISSLRVKMPDSRINETKKLIESKKETGEPPTESEEEFRKRKGLSPKLPPEPVMENLEDNPKYKALKLELAETEKDLAALRSLLEESEDFLISAWEYVNYDKDRFNGNDEEVVTAEMIVRQDL